MTCQQLSRAQQYMRHMFQPSFPISSHRASPDLHRPRRPRTSTCAVGYDSGYRSVFVVSRNTYDRMPYVLRHFGYAVIGARLTFLLHMSHILPGQRHAAYGRIAYGAPGTLANVIRTFSVNSHALTLRDALFANCLRMQSV